MPGSSQPKPIAYNYQDLLTYIKDGFFKLPKFQREFVWSADKSAKLLDSIVKGYPIGTFIIWQTDHRLAHVKNLGGADIPDTPPGHPVKYVLDGQQRLASIFATMMGLTVNNTDYKKICLNLQNDEDDEIISVNGSGKSITIFDLLNSDMGYISRNYSDHIEKIDEYRTRLRTYDFSMIEINDYPIEKAVDIFTRINTSGKALTLFEIMAAKTYDESRGFFLATKYKDMQDELESYKYAVPGPTLLQSISVNLIQKCARKDILELDKGDIIDVYDRTYDAIKKAVDYFKEKYGIQVSKILPYDALVVPFQYFFFKNNANPSLGQADMLEEYFWRASLTSRFSSAVETKLGQDCKRMEDILHDKESSFDELKVTLTAKDIENLKFSTGEAVCKSILCLLSSLRPRSFRDNTEVVLNESNLSKSNSKNYHHFFPKAYLKRRGTDNANVIANITLIGAEDNLRIGSKPPSEYMEEFESNPSLGDTLSTHLIDDLETCGIRTNDYELFLRRRSEKIWQELEKRFAHADL